MMVEAGKARLIETLPGEAGQVCVFPRRGPMGETVAGEQFRIGPLRGSLARQALSHLPIPAVPIPEAGRGSGTPCGPGCRASRCRQEAEAEE
jgi:hypothetical protein